MINIYDINDKLLMQAEVTSAAKREQEMSKSDYISLSFSSADKVILPVGAYINYTYKIDKVREVTRKFLLLESYEPTQSDECSWKYTPQFQHPKMILSKTPFFIYTRNSQNVEVKQNVWSFVGTTSVLSGKIANFLNKDLMFGECGWKVIFSNVTANTVNVSFSDNDFISALTAITNAIGDNCEWHIDYDDEIIYIGKVLFGATPVVLEVGKNVGVPNISNSKESYYNAFSIFGGTRNITQVNSKGENVSSGGIRLQLDEGNGTISIDGKERSYSIDKYSTLDLRVDKINEPLFTKVLDFSQIFPSLNTYVYNVRGRVKYVLDKNKEKIPISNADGSIKGYKTFTVWYMRLAYPTTEKVEGKTIINTTVDDGVTHYWYDFEITDDLLITGKNIGCSFEANFNTGALSTPLAGHGSNGEYVGFELTYHKEASSSHTSDDVSDGNFSVLAGDYEIIYQEDNEVIIPTNKEEMLIPRGERLPSLECNITVLYNIAMADTIYYEDAQNRLLDKAKDEIARLLSDLNNYEVKSYSDVFLEDNPQLQIGQSVTYKDGHGYELATRVLKLSTNIDYDFIQSITIGNQAIKGTITQLKEDVQTIIASGGSSGNGGGYSVYQLRNLIAKYGSDNFISKQFNDTAHGTITFEKVQKFLQGMDIGDNAGQWTRDGVLSVFKFLTNNFEQGLYGHGAQIDEYGNMEANSIFARQFISAPKFVFNEISVTKAEQWNTNGYGTIKSVDVTNHTITLKLEENDYGSLSVGDICRGIYADIDNTYDSDTNNEGEMDECGFTMHRGFFTTYFYVKKIVTAEKGKFVFEYGKRSEVTPDPCAFMDFAQYGSFTDEQRQSSMYFCSRGRSYIEVLDGVNNWEIQTENRVTRYGWLGGLRVKKTDGTWKNLKGNGLFAQNNVYFGGNVEYLGDILGLDDLKNEAKAYDVSLSQYQSVVTVDDMGNVINGLYTQDESNATKQYRISTAVFVRKGTDILLEEDANSENVTEGHYRLHVISDNCDVEVKNSTVFVKSIRNIKDGVAGTEDDTNFDYAAMRKMSDAMVTIVVDLEGKTSKTVQMPIRIQHDSLPFMVCDLSNENASIAWNTKTAKYIGLPITTKVSLMYQNTPWEISDLSIGAVNGLKTSISLQGKEKVITIDADNITSDILEQITKIPITVVGVYAGVRYEYTKELTILRSADMIVYDVVPSVDSVVVDKDGNLNTKSVSCKVYATSSDDRRYALSALPSGYQLKYGYGDTADTALALGGSATASTDHTRITFALYDNKGSLLDQEMVPIVSFGKDGKGIEYIFKRTTDSPPPSNPTPSDWSTNAEYLRTDKEYIPTGWTDDPTGVDAVNLYEWVSKRVSTNGHWGAFSEPAEYAHFGKHAAKATLSDYIVSIPTDSEGNALSEFSEDISCTLMVDGEPCSSISVSADSLPSGVTINGTIINVSYAKGYALGRSSKVVKVKVSGKLDNASYSDTITLTILPNVSGVDGDGYEYVFYLSNSSTPPSKPSRYNGNLSDDWVDDPPSPTDDNRYVYVSYYEGKVGAPNVAQDLWSAPALWTYKAPNGKHAAKATLSDYIVSIPTDSEGNALSAFSEDISCTLEVDGKPCSSLSVSSDSLPSGVTINGTIINVSYAKGYALGRSSKVVKVKVSGKLDNASYSDTITLTILPNVSGVDGDGYEYVFYLSNSSTPPSKPSRYNGNLSDDWVDDPPSPTDDNRYVYVSYYEGKVGAPNVAQDLWSAPVLWAYKAPNGKDGDGLIVGYQSSASEPSVLPTPKTLAEYDKAQDDIGHGWTKTAPATGGKSIVPGGKITTDEIIDRYNSSTSAWGTEESEILLDGIKQRKTFYKTPSSLGDNGKCIRRIKVVNHFRDSYLRVMLKSYSEASYDRVCISRLYLPSEVINNKGEQIKEDSEYLNRSEYAYVVSGDGQSLVANLSMPDAGEYYFFIGYFKDGSNDYFGDYGLFAWQSMIALTESLWRTDGTVDAVGNITWSKAMPMQAEAIVMERAYIATPNDTVAPSKPYRTNGILQGGWTAKRLAVSYVNRFIWESVRAGKHGTDSVQDDWSQPVIVANFAEAGKMGKNGCIVRNSEGWKSGATYHNDSALTLEQKYIDLIYIEDSNANDGWSIYQCNVTHTATGSSFDPSATDSDGNRLWIKLSDAGPMYSPLIVGKNAVLKFAQGQQFNLMEGNNIFGSFRWVKNNADYAFWIGGTSGNVATTSITRGGKFKTTDADITGKITATSGQIAGLKIEGEGLTNQGFDNDAYIILRNDSHKVFAGIGGNVLPASTGTRAVARFTNEESSKYFGDVNYSVVCGAKGAVTNVALDMTLGGYVSGLRIKNTYMSSGGSTYATAKTIDKNVHSVLLAGAGYYQLPKMEKEDDGYVIFVKRTVDSGEVHLCSNVSVTIDAATATDKVGTSFIYYDRGSVTTDLKIESLGDAMMLVYHRDVSFTVTENNKEKKYDGGWIQYKCPRDW